jgi:hypothetical protein
MTGRDAGFLCGLDEIDGHMDQAGRDRPDEIGGIGAFHGRADGIDLEEIAEHHFSTERFQGRGPGIPVVHHRANTESQCNGFPDGGATGVSRGAGNQYLVARAYMRHDSISLATCAGMSDCSQCPAGTGWNELFLK